MSDVSQTAQIATKVFELLEKGATKVGETASTAFPYVVRYEWAQAVTGLSIGLTFLIVAVCGVWGFSRSAKKLAEIRAVNSYHDDSDILVAWGAVIVIATMLSVTFVGINLATVIEPTGATIESILRLAAKTVN